MASGVIKRSVVAVFIALGLLLWATLLFGGAAAIGVGLAQGSRLVMVGGAVSLVIGVSAIVYTHLR